MPGERRRIGAPRAVLAGIAAAARRFRLVLLVAVADLAVAFAAIQPLRSFVGTLADRYAVARLADRFDASVVGDILRSHGGATSVALSAMWAGLLMYLPLAWLMEAGVLGLLTGDAEESGDPLLARFGRSAGRHFVKMARAAAVSAAPYTVALLLLWTGWGLASAATAGTVNVFTARVALELAAAPGVAALLLAVVVADALRVRAVLGLDRVSWRGGFRAGLLSWWRSLGEALRFGLQLRVSSTRLTYAALWVALTFGGVEALARLPHRPGWMLLGFLATQLVAVLRAALAVASYGALVRLAVEEAEPSPWVLSLPHTRGQ